MSISVSFTTESKRVNSTKQPSMSAGTYLCTFKNGCSMLRPTLFLELQQETFPAYTGFMIDNRYYNITDIRSIRQHLFEVDGIIDVLATYKAAIGASSQYILRSSAESDSYVTDRLYPTRNYKTYSRNSDGNGFIYPQSGTFVVGVQGKTTGGSFGSTTYYCMDSYNCKDFMDKVFNINTQDYDAASIEAASGIPEKVYASIINPQQYIVSCMYLPFEYETIGNRSVGSVELGWFTIDGIEALVFNTSYDALPTISKTFNLPKHPQATTRGQYLNNAPYSSYILSYMPFGEIELPADLLIGQSQIHLNLIVDVITGQGTLKVYTGSTSSGQLLASESAQIGVPIAISGGVYDVSLGGAAKKLATGALAASGMAGKMAEMATSFSSFSLEGKTHTFQNVSITNGSQVVSSAADTVAGAVQSPTITTSGSNGALDFLEYDCVLYSRFTHIVDDDNHQHGKPLCKVRTISSIPGYIMCLKPTIDISATATEKDEILAYMTNGFFYE